MGVSRAKVYRKTQPPAAAVEESEPKPKRKRKAKSE